jgi:DNA-binding transcriptional regulator YiaG
VHTTKGIEQMQTEKPARRPAPTRNRAPANEFELMRRMLLCNKAQLAARLGVTPQTLWNWEQITAAGGQQSENTRRAVAELMRTTLRASNNADAYLIDRK